MQPSVVRERVVVPDGRVLVLEQRGDGFVIRLGHVELMASRASGSETALARLGLAAVGDRPTPRVLVGGLGMGFTLRAVLDALAERGGHVVVAELFPDVVRWNRTWLAALAARPLEDPRVEVVEDDVANVLAASPRGFDAVLLDVDNGPVALTAAGNRGLYGSRGIATLRAALRPAGVVGVWSAGPDARFAARLRRGGFEVDVREVRTGPGGKGARHVVFVGRAR